MGGGLVLVLSRHTRRACLGEYSRKGTPAHRSRRRALPPNAFGPLEDDPLQRNPVEHSPDVFLLLLLPRCLSGLVSNLPQLVSPFQPRKDGSVREYAAARGNGGRPDGGVDLRHLGQGEW